MSMEKLPNFYKVKVELTLTPMILRLSMFTFPTIKLETETTVLLQPVTDATTILLIMVTCYGNVLHMETLQT